MKCYSYIITDSIHLDSIKWSSIFCKYTVATKLMYYYLFAPQVEKKFKKEKIYKR